MTPTTLGEHLRRRRLDLALTQRTLAETFGVSTESIRMWERGLAVPLARHYAALVEFLGYDPQPVGVGIGDRLSRLRRRLGLTYRELATLIGFDEGSLCRWTTGNRQPSLWMMSKLISRLHALEAATIGDRPPEVPKWLSQGGQDTDQQVLGIPAVSPANQAALKQVESATTPAGERPPRRRG